MHASSIDNNNNNIEQYKTKKTQKTILFRQPEPPGEKNLPRGKNLHRGQKTQSRPKKPLVQTKAKTKTEAEKNPNHIQPEVQHSLQKTKKTDYGRTTCKKGVGGRETAQNSTESPDDVLHAQHTLELTDYTCTHS